MKRLILSAVAFSMLAIPAVQAAPLNMPMGASQSNVVLAAQHVVKKKIVVKRQPVVRKKVIVKRKPVVTRKVIVKHNNWRRGQKYSGWRQHQPVRDWQRYHLNRPGPGQEWIRVGNDYILVSVLSGVIGGIIAAQ